MKTLWIEHDDPLMPEWTELRSRVLREPLGLQYSKADFEEEKDDRQLVGVIDGKVVGGLLVRLKGQAEGVWKIRQFAVAGEYQGQGIGAQLMGDAEAAAREKGVVELVLHSREVVVGFYKKLGFVTEGERFEEVGVPHMRMRKGLR